MSRRPTDFRGAGSSSARRPAYWYWYQSKEWRIIRSKFLKMHPYCRFCLSNGVQKKGNTVDHIEPHNGNWALFHNVRNLQTLCSSCHSGAKRKIDRARSHDERVLKENWITDGDGWLVRRKASGE